MPGAGLDPRHLGSFPYFYVRFLAAYGYFLRHFSPADAFLFWQHLWFLPRLLAYSMVALPAFLSLRGEGGRRAISRMAGLCERSAAFLLLLGLPLGASEVVLQTGWLTRLTQRWPLYDDWPFFSFGLILFVYGYVLYADRRFAPAITRRRFAALLLGFAICAAIVALALLDKAPAAAYSPGYVAFMLARALGIWSLILGILGLAMRHLAFTNAVGHYLREATYALYLLHTVPLMVIAFFVLRWPIPWPLQLALLIAATLLAAVALYDLLIRRWSVLRLLFGMRPRG